tara:strand:- start:838 stop:1059 length:222 start_codon:yes stop_codon:yes gene_type:complete
MEFKQNKEDGSCEIIFSEKEKKIINDKGKLFLSAVFLKHFGNNLIKIVADWNLNFNEDVKKLISNSSKIEDNE